MQLVKWHSKKVVFKNQGYCMQAFPAITLPRINIHNATEFGLKPSTSSSESALVSAPGEYGYLAWMKRWTQHYIRTKGGSSPSARPEQCQRSANGCIEEDLLRSLANWLRRMQSARAGAKTPHPRGSKYTTTKQRQQRLTKETDVYTEECFFWLWFLKPLSLPPTLFLRSMHTFALS